MGMRGLAEGIILQAMEDLWNKNQRKDCITFFKGEGISICTEISGMNLYDEVRLFNLINGIIKQESLNTAIKKEKFEHLPTLQRKT